MTKYLKTFAAVLSAGALLTACGSADPGPASPSATSADDQALAFSKCMREHGVPKFPDPGDNGKLVVSGDLNPQSPEFQKAQEACKDLNPQGQAQSGGGTLDAAKVSAWAQCVRDHGEPTFADPEIDGTTLKISLAGINPRDGKFQQAMSACQRSMPQGANVQISGGGGR